MIVSLILIIIGVFRENESVVALVGFTFLFLLSFVVMGGNLEYQTGEMHNQTIIDNSTITQIDYSYSNYTDTSGFFNTQKFGFFLAVASVFGFIAVYMGLGKKRRRK